MAFVAGGWLARLGLGALLANTASKVLKHIVKKSPRWIAHVLGALGLYFIVMEPVLEEALQFVIGKFGEVPPEALATLYYLNVDNYFAAVFSAFTVRATGQIALRKRTAGA